MNNILPEREMDLMFGGRKYIKGEKDCMKKINHGVISIRRYYYYWEEVEMK